MSKRGINNCQFIGNLGQDPETRYTNDGKAVTNFSIAISETWKDKNTGQPQEKTEWIRIVAFSRLAEICGEYLKKGSKVYIQGEMRTRKWQDQQGADKYTTEIVAKEMQMLDSKAQAAQEQHESAAPPSQSAGSGFNHGGKTVDDFLDDEIPF